MTTTALSFTGKIDLTIPQLSAQVARLQNEEIIEFLEGLFKAIEQDALTHNSNLNGALTSLACTMANDRKTPLVTIFENIIDRYKYASRVV